MDVELTRMTDTVKAGSQLGLTIRTLDGRSYPVEVDAGCTVASLKAKISELEKVSSEGMRLIFSAREMEVLVQ